MNYGSALQVSEEGGLAAIAAYVTRKDFEAL